MEVALQIVIPSFPRFGISVF